MRIYIEILFIVFAVSVSSCAVDTTDIKNDVKFDSDKWKSGDNRTRGRMSESLLNDSILIGLDKSAIIDLLGEPHQIGDERFHYPVDLGIEFMSTPWGYLLTIEFDPGSKESKLVWIAD